MKTPISGLKGMVAVTAPTVKFPAPPQGGSKVRQDEIASPAVNAQVLCLRAATAGSFLHHPTPEASA